MKLQKAHVLDSESSSSDSDHVDQEPYKLLENKDKMINLLLLGKIKRIFNSYQSNAKDLSVIDRNLLRGVLKKKLKDYDNDYKAQF